MYTMAKGSFLSFLSSSIGGSNVTTFLDLDYSKEIEEEDDKSDISKLAIEDTENITPSLHLTTDSKPEIPIIGIGGAGIRLLHQVVNRINLYGMNYLTLAIDTDITDIEKYANISHKYHIPGAQTGTAHQYRQAATRVSNAEDEIREKLTKYFQELGTRHKHEIVFLLMGAGGTGTGAGIELAKILISMGKRPVPFLLLPSKEEISRIKFNAAAALYHFSLAPKDRCLNLATICIDNELMLDHNSKKYYSAVISAANERIAATLGDLIATTELESHAYSADLNEFLEIFRDLKCLGVLQYLQVKNPGKNISKSFEKNLQDSLSMDVDIFQATRAYFYVSTIPKQILAEDYRQLMLKFDNADVFNKLYETENDGEFLAIRGIYTGLSYSENIRNIMQLAEDARVEILNKEIENNNLGKVNPKIDRLASDEEISVRTGSELSEERAEEFARMHREGDKH